MAPPQKMAFLRSFFLLALLGGGSGSAILPRISYSDLKSASQRHDESAIGALRDAGGKLSAFAVIGLDQARFEYSEQISRFRASLSDCFDSRPDLPEIELTDGSARRTYATAEGRFLDCEAGEAAEAISEVFEAVEIQVAQMVEAVLGRHLTYKVLGDHHPTCLMKSPRKDHLHLYRANQTDVTSSTINSLMVPSHVDNGLFLLLTPSSSSSLLVWQSDGTPTDTADVGDDAVLVLFGRGLTEWFLQDEYAERKLFAAAPHAVPALKESERAVYARMKVAPGGAVPTLPPFLTRRPRQAVSFDEVFLSSSHDPERLGADSASRLWVASAKEQCDEGFEYCWMNCLPLSDQCGQEDAICQNEVGSECADDDMDATCAWTCQEPETETGTEQVIIELSDFCNGKADMLMGGFDVAGDEQNPCIILFIDAWTLDTPWKFALGCVGVALIGLGTEALIWFRRRRQQSGAAGRDVSSLAVSVACYFGNLFLGYLAMLVAMTYSVELFASVCLGLVMGHALFNSRAAVGETVDPCCATSQNQVVKEHDDSRSDKSSRQGQCCGE